MQFLSQLAILKSWSMHHSLCKFRQNSFCLSSIYVRFYERTVPISFEPLFQRFKKRRVFCRIEVKYTQSAYTILVTKGRTSRVSLKIQLPINVFDVLSMLYDCITLLLQRFSFVFTMYRLSKGISASLLQFQQNLFQLQ